MTGAMYAAIGGLKTHMTNLNVIGNNIANVNTAGYKSQRMTFQEAMYTTSRAGSNGTLVLGGNNPSQIGYGAQVGSIDLNMSPGTFNPTGLDLDCKIEGDGFFLVGDKDLTFATGADFTKPQLSRVGDFWQDPQGYICNRDGKVVYGFASVQNPYFKKAEADLTDADKKAMEELGVTVDDEYMVSSDLVPLRVPLAAAQPTVENGGIDATTGEEKWQVGDPVFDLLGPADATNNNARKNYSWVDEKTGLLKDVIKNQVSGQTGAGNTPATYSGVEFTDSPGTGTTTGTATTGAGAAAYKYTGVIPNNEGKIATIDGLKVTTSGAIVGTSDTGKTVVVGYVGIAKVTAPDGVTHVGGPYYKCMEGAGEIKVGAVGGVMEGRYLNNQLSPAAIDTGNAGGNTQATDNRNIIDSLSPCSGTELRGGGLEASTADVATEFSNMILTQRGYQANTRIVTVTDSMLEELVNMKR